MLLERIVLSVSVGCGAAASAGPPVLSDPNVFPGDRAAAPGWELQDYTDLVAGGDRFLAVWDDQRTSLNPMVAFGGGPYFLPGYGNMRDITGAVLDAEGNIVAGPIVIANQGYGQTRARAAWNGSHWLVTWLSERDPYNMDVFAVRIAPDGTQTDAQPIEVFHANGNWEPYDLAITANSSGWLVAWHDFNGSARLINGVRIGADGSKVDATPRSILTESNNFTMAGDLELAHAAGVYFFAWQDCLCTPSLLFGHRFDENLAPLGARSTIDNTRGGPVGLAAGNNQFYLTWASTGVRGSRITTGGTNLDPGGTQISASPGWGCDAAWDGQEWVLAYESNVDSGDVRGARVSADGVVLVAEVPFHANNLQSFRPSVAAIPGHAARISWSEWGRTPFSNADVYHASFVGDSSGATHDLGVGIPMQYGVKYVQTPSGFATVYVHRSSGDSRVLFQRFDRVGAAIDAEPLVVAQDDEGVINAPDVGWDGNRYLVAWTQLGAKARRISANGSFLDPAPISLFPGLSVGLQSVAGMNGRFLVAGSQLFSGDQRTLRAVRIDGAAGTLLDATPLFLGGSYPLQSKLVVLGGRWLLVWENQFNHDHSASDIRGRFVTLDGSLVPEFIVSSAGDADDPDMIVNGTNALVVYNKANSIVANILDASGASVTGSFTVFNAAAAQLAPAAGFDGTHYVVAWSEYSPGYPEQPRGDTFAARVALDGTVLDPAFVVFPGPLPAELPRLIGLDGGRAMIAASVVFDGDGRRTTPRITYRILGETCAADFDGDGFLTGLDFDAYVAAFEAGDVISDFDGDGFVTGLDFDAYVAAFEAGC